MGVKYSEAQSIFARGPHQTNYQTEVAPDDDPKNYRWITKDGYAKATFESPNINNAGESTGLAFPDETSKDRDTSSFAAQEQLTYQLLGMLAYDAYGVAATPVVVSAGAVWKHVFTLLDPHVSQTLPTRPLAQKIGEPASSANVILDSRMASMTYNRLTITDNTDKPGLIADSEWIGSGKNVEPSGVQFYGTGRHVVGRSELNEEKINKRSGVATLYPQVDFGGTPIATTCLIREFTQTINENLDTEGGYIGCALFQDDDPAKGAIAGSMDTPGQTGSLEFLVVADSAIVQDLDLLERLKTGDEFSAQMLYTGSQIGITGFDHYAKFKFNRLVIATIEWVPVDGGKQGLRIVCEPLASGNVMPFSLELQTNVASFATYVGA